MNPFAAFLNGLTSRTSALILGCASVGLLGGIVGGVIHFSRQSPVFESSAILYPSSASWTGAPADWMKQEAAAMLEPENLGEAARRINMGFEHHLSDAQCVERLKNAVTVSIIMQDSGAPQISDRSPDAPQFPVLRIAARGESAGECSAIVSAIISHREGAWLAAENLRLQPTPEKKAETKRMLEHTQELRAELVSGLPAVGVLEKEISDSRLVSLPLSGVMKELRDQWIQSWDAWRSRQTETAASASRLRPYADFLEEPHASVTPISPRWGPYGWPWIAGGLGAGLLAGLVFRQLRAWRSVNVPAPDLARGTALEF